MTVVVAHGGEGGNGGRDGGVNVGRYLSPESAPWGFYCRETPFDFSSKE